MGGEVVCDDDRALTCDLARVVGATVAPKERPVFPILREAYLAPGGKDRAGEELGFDGVGGGGVADCAPFHPLPHAKPFQQWRSVMSDSRQSPLLPVGEWHQPQAPEGARRPGGARRGPVITGVVNRLALAAVLITGLTVTACSAASAPASNGGSGAAAPAGQGNRRQPRQPARATRRQPRQPGSLARIPAARRSRPRLPASTARSPRTQATTVPRSRSGRPGTTTSRRHGRKPRTARSRVHSGTPPPAWRKSSLMSRTC